MADQAVAGVARRRGGGLADYTVTAGEGKVVLGVLHRLQATNAGDLTIRWNCKAVKEDLAMRVDYQKVFPAGMRALTELPRTGAPDAIYAYAAGSA